MWLKDFDKQTCEKNKDWPRLLLLDGHNSHYTLEFMQYAKSVNIHVLCYPSHCTHVLQGLDVVVFAGFKKIWTRRRDQRITDNPFAKFGKLAWIAVWTAAFLEAMTVSTIKSSFRATGVIPFNPGVVTPRMMAPSIQHSTRAELPGPLASPVKKMINHHRAILRQSKQAPSPTPIHPSQDVHMFDVGAGANVTADNDASSGITNVDSDGHDIVPRATHSNQEHQRAPTLQAVIDPELLADHEGGQLLAAALATSSASILVLEETLTCAYHLPELVYGPRPVIPAMDMNVLHRPTAMSPAAMAAQIEEMRATLVASHAHEKVHLDTHDAMGAQLALAGMYVSKTQLQLANAEECKKRVKGVRIDFSPCGVKVLRSEDDTWDGEHPISTNGNHHGHVFPIPFTLLVLHSPIPTIDTLMDSITTKWEATLVKPIYFRRLEFELIQYGFEKLKVVRNGRRIDSGSTRCVKCLCPCRFQFLRMACLEAIEPGIPNLLQIRVMGAGDLECVA